METVHLYLYGTIVYPQKQNSASRYKNIEHFHEPELVDKDR